MNYNVTLCLVLKLHSVFLLTITFMDSVHLSYIFKNFATEKRLVRFLMNKALKISERIIVLTTFTFPKELGIAKIMKAYF